MADNPTIIVGHLDDSALRDSIDKLVKYVGDKTNDMASNFTQGLDKMKLAMKDFAVTQQVSVNLMQEAWRKMSSAFDAMVAAQSAASSSPSKTKAYPDNTIGALEQEIAALKKERKEMELGSAELREQNKLLDERKRKLTTETTSQAKNRLGNAFSMPTNNLDEAQKKLRLLEILQRRYANTTELSVVEQNKLANAIARVKNQVERLKSGQPKSLKEVLGMDESSVDAIARKMRALKFVSINPQNAAEVNKLGTEYQRLSRLQATLLGKNIQLTHSNNYLAQSFGYIRNRIMYALTLGAITNFTKQIYEVRGQYELLERSLGILIDNMRRGSEIFNELNAMALKSPFTLMELATGAKQLMAYNFAEDEVVETTRRLADISSALGVPMERLVYNLGQIRAQTHLTARDARDFANAGLAIVPMLADLYTKQKKFGDEIVTTAQVYDMMSNKMVSYADVMKVITSITDEGGKFFNFQAKQAETMIVQMNNLKLSWNNMLNEIGRSNQELLTAPLKGMKLLFENWQSLINVIKGAVVALGLYYTRATMVSLINGTLITQGTIRAGYLLAQSFYAAKNALIALRTVILTNPIGVLATALGTAIGYMALFNNKVEDIGQYTKKFGEDGAKVVRDVESMYVALESLDKESSTYQKVLGELNQILGDFNLKQYDEKDAIDVVINSREKNISLIKEEIIERKHLNDLEQGKTEYNDAIESARKKLRSNLSNAITENFFGVGSINEEITKNAPALANIISDIIENNIELVANKTGDEYEKGVEKIFAKIQERLRNNKALGLSEDVINSSWLENNFFRFYKSNIIENVINDLKEAKEANDAYNNSVNDNYEAEKKATEQGASFNDRVEQTSDSLMKAANDTDKFYKKIDQLIKDYSGQNIIEFLVKIKADIPDWMNQKSLGELTRLAARFSALATQAKRSGKESIDFGNGVTMTIAQMYERAAQYAQAAKNKQGYIDSRKSTTLTQEASQALKDYKAAIEAVNVVKNRMKQGTADQTLLTEKETEAQKKYNDALKKGVSEAKLKKVRDGKSSGRKKDVLGDALVKEVQLINDLRRSYKDYQAAGHNAFAASALAAKDFNKSLEKQKATLSKFGVKGLSGEQLASMNLRQMRDYFSDMLTTVNKLGNAKGIEALERVIKNINDEIAKVDYKTFSDSLNNELGKLKDEYELAVSFDADPELGSAMADLMGLNMDTLPHTVEAYAKEATKILNKFLSDTNSGMELPHLFLTDDDLRSFEDMVKQGTLNEEVYKKIADAVKDVRDKRKKDFEETTKEFNALIKKYGEYQAKMEEVRQTADKERLTFVKTYGGEEEIKQAIQLTTEIGAEKDPTKKQQLRQQLIALVNQLAGDDATRLKLKVAIDTQQARGEAGVDFEEFQKSPDWIIATGDLANMTNKAIGGLIDSLEEYKKSAKNLDSKQIKQINNALKSLYKQHRQNNPFGAISDAIDQARENASLYDEKLQEMEDKINDYFSRWEDLTNEEKDALGELIDEYDKLRAKKEEVSKINASAVVSGLNNAISSAKSAASMFGELAEAIGGEKMNDAAKTVKKIVGVLDKAGQGAQIGSAFGGYGAAIGAIIGTIIGFVTEFRDELSGNAGINAEIQYIKEDLIKLNTVYKRLQDEADNSYGWIAISAKKAVIANKELQLEEMKRQLRMEESRKEKDKDYEQIENLKGQIVDLELEIKNASNDIINDLLGISGVGDAMESLMDGFIEALRSGEDAMAVFNESIDDMIVNMVKKMFVTKILQPWFEEQWNKIQNDINSRATHEQQEYDRIANMTDEELAEKLAVERMRAAGIRPHTDEWENSYYKYLKDVTKEDIENYRKTKKAALDNAIIPTTDDIRKYAELLRTGQPVVEESMKEVQAFLEELGLMKETSADKNLSALQQGIQGITETTAGALEAYMNGVSQQVYLQSTLMMQINETIQSFDIDVQTSTLGDILLQLQNSYQVQQSIQTILNGWSTPSGLAVRVEMN